MRPGALLILIAALPAFSCSELPAIPATGCGNRLVEPASEDCDGSAEPTARCAGPGEAHACRYVCRDAGGNGFSCPVGYACGADGVCRTPSGSFQQAGRSVEVASASLQVGDFDDNKQAEVLALGTSDLIGRAPAQVVFFGEGLERATTQAIPGLLGNPAVGRFADSPYAGIAFGSLPGLAMLIGRRDRQFFPRSYPSFQSPPGVTATRIYAPDLLPPSLDTNGNLFHLGDEPILFVTLDGNHLLLSISVGADDKALAALPRGPDELEGDLVWGKFQESLHCPSLVFPFKNATELLVVTPCESDGKGGVRLVASPAQPQVLPLPPGLQLRTRPVVADVDQDGHLDLLLGAASEAQPGRGASWISYGDGAGGFHTQPGGVGPGGFFLFTLPETQVSDGCGVVVDPKEIKEPELAEFLKGKALVPAPLAVAELDGDGKPDLVMPYGICTSRDLLVPGGPPHYRLVAGPLGGVWTEALTMDLNGDGRLDVVGAPEVSRALDLFLGSSQGLFNAVTIPLNGSPGLLAAGDFDGDGSTDVTFRERGVQGTSNVGAATGDALTVLFTSPGQVPTQIGRVGRFEQILHLASGSTPDGIAIDGISDIGVISGSTTAAEPTPSSPSVSLFYGSSDRALRSPLALQANLTENSNDIALPVLFVPGLFTQNTPASQQDIFAVSSGSAATQEASLSCPGDDNPRPGRELRLWLVDLGGDAKVQGLYPSAPLDLGGVGVLDIDCPDRGQLTAGDLDGDGFDEVLFAVPTVGGQSKVFVGRTRGAAASPEILPPLPLALELAPGGRPLILDVDGDGKRDALLLVQQGGAPQLAVLWGKGDGAFEEAPALLALPEQSVRGLCEVKAADGRREPLLLGDAGLFRLGASRQLAATPVEQFTSEQRGGLALACGDLDGDGVDDVAISSGSLLRVFRGLPVRP